MSEENMAGDTQPRCQGYGERQGTLEKTGLRSWESGCDLRLPVTTW